MSLTARCSCCFPPGADWGRAGFIQMPHLAVNRPAEALAPCPFPLADHTTCCADCASAENPDLKMARNDSSKTVLSGAEVRLTGVSRHWGSTTALNSVSLYVRPGSFAVLLGPSGCGKTTCLRIVAGLETASSGTVEIGGRDVTNLPPAARGVAMVFQSYALFPHLTVAENIVFGLKARRVPPAERARRLDRAVEILGIGALLQRKPSNCPAVNSNVSRWAAPSSPRRRCA